MNEKVADFRERIRGTMKGAAPTAPERARAKTILPVVRRAGERGDAPPEFITHAEFHRRFQKWEFGRTAQPGTLHSYLTGAIERRAGELATHVMGRLDDLKSSNQRVTDSITKAVLEARHHALLAEFSARHKGQPAREGMVTFLR